MAKQRRKTSKRVKKPQSLLSEFNRLAKVMDRKKEDSDLIGNDENRTIETAMIAASLNDIAAAIREQTIVLARKSGRASDVAKILRENREAWRLACRT